MDKEGAKRDDFVKFNRTSRGFQRGEFTDLYGCKCSIQESSLATDDAIWFGVNDANPQILASKARKINPETGEMTGWVAYPVPDDVLMHTRMHLNREQVAALILVLQNFVDTGFLPPAPEKEG